MSPLFARELRRLAPYGLGAAGLLGVALVSFTRPEAQDLAFLTFLAGALLGPGVVGVASVAPDSSSGGAAFLVRLPIPAPVVLRHKLAASAVWTLAIGAAVIAVYALTPRLHDGLSGPENLLGLLGAQLLSLGIGCAASVLTPRVLPAVLLAPSVGIMCLLVLLGVPLVAWRIPPTDGLVQVVAPLTGLLMLGGAAVAYLRGETHRASLKPALLLSSVLLPGLLFGVGATGVAHAWTVESLVPRLQVSGPGAAAPGRALVAIPLSGRSWTGLEQRMVVMAGPMVFGGAEGAVVLPQRGVEGPEFSPDGERLLLRASSDPGGWLVDLRSGASLRLPGAAPVGFGFPWVVWRGGQPVMVRMEGDGLQVFWPDPAAADLEPEELGPWTIRQPLAGQQFVGTLLDGRIAVERHDGLFAYDPPRPTPSLGPGQVAPPLGPGAPLFRWSGGTTLAVAVSPRGRAALRVTSEDPRAVEVWSGDRLCSRLNAVIPAGVGARAFSRERIGWSDEEGFVAVAGVERRTPLGGGTNSVSLESEVSVISLTTGTLLTTLRGPWEGPVVWSSGEDAWVALPSGEMFDLRSCTPSRLPVAVAAGVGAERFVPLGLPLQRVLEGRDRVSGGAR